MLFDAIRRRSELSRAGYGFDVTGISGSALIAKVEMVIRARYNYRRIVPLGVVQREAGEF